MQQLVRSFSTSTVRTVAALISITGLALLSTSAAAQCAAMTHTAHSPGYGSTVTSLTAPPLSVTFNYPVNNASINTNINTGNVRMYEYNTGVKVAITATASGNTINIKPVAALRAGTLYRYYVSAGITGNSSCGALVYNSNHGNNWNTAAACATTEDFVNNTVTLNTACKYDIAYTDGYYLNVNADELTLKSTLGTFAYSRGADPNLQWQQYSSFAPDMYDFGLGIAMTNVTYNAAQNKWIAGTVTVTGYNDNGNGGQLIPTLNTYTNIAVANGGGPLSLTRKVANKVWNYYCGCTVLQDVSANYPPWYATGTATAKP